MITIKLTEKQANIILHALANESYEDDVQFGEYGYYRCYMDVRKKIVKANNEK